MITELYYIIDNIQQISVFHSEKSLIIAPWILSARSYSWPPPSILKISLLTIKCIWTLKSVTRPKIAQLAQLFKSSGKDNGQDMWQMCICIYHPTWHATRSLDIFTRLPQNLLRIIDTVEIVFDLRKLSFQEFTKYLLI